MAGPLKIAIDAQISRDSMGGVASVTMALIHALGRLRDGSEAYTIIVSSPEQLEWLQPILGPNQQSAVRPHSPSYRERVQRWVGGTTFSRLVRHTLRPLQPVVKYLQQPVDSRLWPEVPLSDGFYESLGCDVVHIPTKNFVLCALPTVYNPHDLQHLHYPQFFTPSVIAWRETIYPAGCHFANTVIVGSQWVKDDIVRQYRIDPDKIQVIPEGPPTGLQQEPPQDVLTAAKEKYQLEQPFGLYPAITWPHKNHIPLLEALAHLRDTRNLIIRLVCTGSRYEAFWPHIKSCVDELQLSPQVKFLGFVPDEDLRAIYRLSQFVVVPSLFEASSLPIFEAWLEGVPVACSNATALPQQVLDAALLFDPHSVESIANAIAKLAADAKVRARLTKWGQQRLQDFDWERTAKAYRAVYRRAAGFPLTEEDRWLLSHDWMRQPERKLEARL
jgi:glycosyltransferase involved in cell wall biosynthesis